MISRAEQTSLFDKIADNASEKSTINAELKTMLQNKSSISTLEGRQARRSGFFTKVAKDLYQDVATKNFWKINTETNTVERVVATDDQGIIKE